ncbi:mitochondrial import receptor subunit tom70 [Elsinoe australis]|uniref:Mitochondrial import receptor subunit tom70 n=1 Tax=Elsinoe australis TaxID=40998 RepID=A0A4U7ARK8_9PEZI|nr:mitochondrial import receptor subunit tom70 [Elsinoe australis]
MADSVSSGASAPTVLDASKIADDSSSLWDRITSWAADNKSTVYTLAGVTLVVTSAGAIYYLSSSTPSDEASAEKRKARKEKKKAKKDVEKGEKSTPEKQATTAKPPTATVEAEEELPQVTEESVGALSEQDKKDYAAKLKAAGNKAYGSKDYNRAIDLYGQALLCKADPVFYSNRAACWNAMSNWDRVIEDTTAALNLDAEYVKALNRRANAYEQSEKYSEALLDYTASCIIDGFRNDASAQSVERLLKKVAEAKAANILKGKPKKLPSPTFVSNYLQSFRPKPLPQGLEQDAELDENSGKGQLRKGLQAVQKRSGEGYTEASEAFDKALELGGLDNHEALAYNMRGTFKYLKGEDNAIDDLNKSLELDQGLIQSYVKRASMHLEAGDRAQAKEDFEIAIKQDERDPDIYYHRAQLNFILSEFGEAAKDYQKSIDLDKDFIFSHIQLGVTQYKMGSIASSMATFRRCMKNFDKVPDVYNYYGELLLDQQKYEEAIQKFETAVELEKKEHVTGMNVLPLINKALALFQWKQDFKAAEDLCQKALIIDPDCDIAVATMAQLLLQQGKVTEALEYFERAAELSRTEGEIVNALSYAEATRTQLEVQEKYPQLASRLQGMGMGGPPPGMR